MSNAAPACPKCNTAYHPGAKFCRNCGQALPTGMPSQTKLPQLPQQQPPQPPYPPQLPPQQQPLYQQPQLPPQQQQPPQQPYSPAQVPPQQPYPAQPQPPYPPQMPPQQQPQQPYQPQPPVPQPNWQQTGVLESMANTLSMSTDQVSILLGVSLAVVIFACGGFGLWYVFVSGTPPTPTPTPTATTPITSTVAAVVPISSTIVNNPSPTLASSPVATAPTTAPIVVPPTLTPTLVVTTGTSTPLPTLLPSATPIPPTATPAVAPVIPLPTATPVITSTILFEDEFETGVKSNWTINAKTETVSGELVAQGAVEIYLGMGVPTWKDYTISLEFGSDSQVKQLVIFTRIQDEFFSKYLDVDCQGGDSPLLNCKWQRGFAITDRRDVLGTEFIIPQTTAITIEVKGQNYSVVGQNNFLDNQNTAEFGGVGLYIVSGDNKPFKLKYFRVVANK